MKPGLTLLVPKVPLKLISVAVVVVGTTRPWKLTLRLLARMRPSVNMNPFIRRSVF